MICSIPRTQALRDLCNLTTNRRSEQEFITDQLRGIRDLGKISSPLPEVPLALGGDGPPEPIHLRAQPLDLRHLPPHPLGDRRVPRGAAADERRRGVGGRGGRRGEALDAGHAVACREQQPPRALVHLRQRRAAGVLHRRGGRCRRYRGRREPETERFLPFLLLLSSFFPLPFCLGDQGAGEAGRLEAGAGGEGRPTGAGAGGGRLVDGRWRWDADAVGKRQNERERLGDFFFSMIRGKIWERKDGK